MFLIQILFQHLPDIFNRIEITFGTTNLIECCPIERNHDDSRERRSNGIERVSYEHLTDKEGRRDHSDSSGRYRDRLSTSRPGLV